MLNIFCLLLASAIPVVIFILPIIDLNDVVKKIDVYSPFWIFSLQFGIGLLLFIKLSKDFLKWLNSSIPNPKFLIPVFLITILAIFICLAWIEPSARVQADESVYMTTAQNLYHNQIGIHCMEGTFLENGGLTCVIKESVKARGISYLYMLGMPFFGTDLFWVYNFQTFILALTLPLFFLALRAWTKNDYLSLLATALLANCPILLFLSRSSSPEALYVFLIALALLFLKWACDRNTIRHWLLLALTLAFFAQTRSETVLCLFAFIGVAWWRICISPNPKSQTLNPKFLLSTAINSQLSIFLLTLSFFCIPILCTLSLGRNNSLQGGAYSAYGHLFENITVNFKLMAFPEYGSIAYQNFLPYFTWFALFGLITLIVLTIKEFRYKSKNIPKYLHITLFLFLLSPQYFMLFNAVSADFNLVVQQRFILVVLPIMSFLGALFLFQIAKILSFINLFNKINIKIPLFGFLIIISCNTLFFYEIFKQDLLINSNTLIIEDNIIKKWIKKEPEKCKLLFYGNSTLAMAHGISAYGYYPAFSLDSTDIENFLEEYNGEVYFVKGLACRYSLGVPKMVTGSFEPICDRFETYFKTEIVLDTTTADYNYTKIFRITGLTDRDPQNILRIFSRDEVKEVMKIHYMMLKKEHMPWKIQRFLNDSLVLESEYKPEDIGIDYFPFSFFNKDTNSIDMRIIDTITNEQIHSDYWKLIKVKK